MIYSNRGLQNNLGQMKVAMNNRFDKILAELIVEIADRGLTHEEFIFLMDTLREIKRSYDTHQLG